ncbi:MAG: hypothetical protein M3Z96_06350 [Pseudomonadota bacterium]|nr:hypothetical protein [Pseudomonadota bacterium]
MQQETMPAAGHAREEGLAMIVMLASSLDGRFAGAIHEGRRRRNAD